MSYEHFGRSRSIHLLISTMAVCAVFLMTPGLQGSSAEDGDPSTDHYVGAELCASCHEAEYAEWDVSKHKQAFSTTFNAYWEKSGKNIECLQCHTTGFDKETGQFSFKGISCEACHGAYQPGHPQSQKMVLPVDSSICETCHKYTYREWQLSGHGKKNVRCFDCHSVHKQGLRYPEAESQCGACHPQRLEDFTHSTHHFQGLTCTTCHMPEPPATDVIGGTGAPAHTFFVGAKTCAGCHEEMVHKSHKIPSGAATEAERLVQQANTQHIGELTSKIGQLELALDVQRAHTVKAAVGALVAGVLLSALVVLWLLRPKKNGLPK